MTTYNLTYSYAPDIDLIIVQLNLYLFLELCTIILSLLVMGYTRFNMIGGTKLPVYICEHSE